MLKTNSHRRDNNIKIFNFKFKQNNERINTTIVARFTKS